MREAAVQGQGLVLHLALGLHRTAELAVGRQRHGRVEDEVPRGDRLAGGPIGDVPRFGLELQRCLGTAEAHGGVDGRCAAHVGAEGGEARQIEHEIERAGLLAAATRDGERAAVAAEPDIAHRPGAVVGQRGVAREAQCRDQAGGDVRRAEIVDAALPARREIALVDSRIELDLSLAHERAAGHRRKWLEAGQVDRGTHLTLVGRGYIVAIAPDACERQGDVEGSHRDLVARNTGHVRVERDRAGLRQSRVERRELQLLDLALYADATREFAVGLQAEALPRDTLGANVDGAGLERGLEAGVVAVLQPAQGAFRRRPVACFGRQFRRAVLLIALRRELEGDFRQVGPLHQRRDHAAGILVERDVGGDLARRAVDTHVGGQLAFGTFEAIGRELRADLAEVAGNGGIAADLPM